MQSGHILFITVYVRINSMSEAPTPIWTDKDRELYRKLKEAEKRGEITYKSIE